MGELYQLIFPNGKSYIGITHYTAKHRFCGHLNGARGSGSNPVHHAIRKYNEVVEVKTLVVADDWDYLCDLEQKAIKAFNTKLPHGYNMTEGGEGTFGLFHSEDTRAKISASKTPEVRKKMSEVNKGRIRSEETRAKLSLAHKGRKESAETREKKSQNARRPERLEQIRTIDRSKGLAVLLSPEIREKNRQRMILQNKASAGKTISLERKEKLRKGLLLRWERYRLAKEEANGLSR